MIGILLADHRQLERDAMRFLLEQTSDLHVVSEASDGTEALSRFAATRPDVSILDASMPGMNNCEMLGTTLSIDAKAQILLVTTARDPLSAAMAV